MMNLCFVSNKKREEKLKKNCREEESIDLLTRLWHKLNENHYEKKITHTHSQIGTQPYREHERRVS